MRTTIRRTMGTWAAAWLLALTGCGGGGGGGGGFPVILPPPDAPATTVMVNGKAVAVETGTALELKSGDRVEISASPDADWRGSADTTGLLTLSETSVTGSRWTARLRNTTYAEQRYTLSLQRKEGLSGTRTIAFRVGPSQDYRVFTAHGTRLMLALDMAQQTYEFIDAAGTTVGSGVVVPDPAEQGTFRFYQPSMRWAPVQNARFRLTDDTVVGAFPFPRFAGQSTTAHTPFVASRSFIARQEDLAGTFNRVYIRRTDTGAGTKPIDHSLTQQLGIAAGGAELQLCDDLIGVTRIENCPVPLVRYAVTASADATEWRFENKADANDRASFSIARIGGQKVLLQAGTLAAAPNTQAFGIGLPESSDWPAATAAGGDSLGGWGQLRIGASTLDTAIIDATGAEIATSHVLTGPTGGEPRGLRTVNELPSSVHFYVLQSRKLVVTNGLTGKPEGSVQIGLKD